MKLVFGLGNPGEKYRLTRHNIGFLVIDYLSKFYNVGLNSYLSQAIVGEGYTKEEKIILAKPLIFVNESGHSLFRLQEEYQIKLKDIILISDDVNLEIGRIKIAKKGGDGGHKGLRSIIQCLNTDQIPRLRLGIGSPDKKEELKEYVLEEFTFQEKKIIKETIERAGHAVDIIIVEGIDKAMREYNRKST
ncbi:MAG: aminoacyl-tRNA hydrolase [Candidatus Aerophobetes bacterium]|nr:aminoacyl-tRNA hydrolase [Candidatus Aerophobetes bacterium]